METPADNSGVWKGWPDDWCQGCGAPLYDGPPWHDEGTGFDMPGEPCADFCDSCAPSENDDPNKLEGSWVRGPDGEQIEYPAWAKTL